MLPYYEKQGSIHGTTYREYLGGHGNPEFQTMTPADMADMLDPEAVNKLVNELWVDPDVAAAYDGLLNEAKTRFVPEAEAMATEWTDAMLGPQGDSSDYLSMIADLEKLNLDEEARKMVASDLATLTQLDPSAAATAGQNFYLYSAQETLARAIADPEFVDKETFEVAFRDSVAMGLAAARNGVNSVLTFPSQAMWASLNITDATMTRLSGIVYDATAWIRKVGGTSVGLQQAIDMQMSMVSAAERNGLVTAMMKLQKQGVWGTAASAAAIGSMLYKINQGAWSADSTPLERWGAARDLITALSYSNNPLFLISDLVGRLPGGDSQATATALGLDRTLPQIWGKGPSGWVSEDFRKGFGNLFAAYDDATVVTPGGAIPAPPENLDPALKRTANVASRVAQSIQKLFAYGLHFVGGVADIVTGAMQLDQSIKNSDKAGVAIASLQIGAGAGLTAAGVLLGLQTVTSIAPWWAAAVWPFATAAAALGAAAAVVGLIVNKVQAREHHNNLQAFTDQQTDTFNTWEDLGLTQGDISEKLEYIRYAYAAYGNDNPNPDVSYFDHQAAEFQNFLAVPQEDGSSLNRLDHDLHVHTSGVTRPYLDVLYDHQGSDVSSWGAPPV